MNTPYYTAYNGWEIERQKLIAELAAMHKVVIDAMAAASEAPGRTEAYEEMIAILGTAPEPSDEIIAAIEAADTEGADNGR